MEEIRMKKLWLLVFALALASIALSAEQNKPVLVVKVFTTSPGVTLPYDMKQMQAQLVAEFKTMLGKEFDTVAEAPTAPQGTVYTLEGATTPFHPVTAPKRILVGLDSVR